MSPGAATLCCGSEVTLLLLGGGGIPWRPPAKFMYLSPSVRPSVRPSVPLDLVLLNFYSFSTVTPIPLLLPPSPSLSLPPSSSHSPSHSFLLFLSHTIPGIPLLYLSYSLFLCTSPSWLHSPLLQSLSLLPPPPSLTPHDPTFTSLRLMKFSFFVHLSTPSSVPPTLRPLVPPCVPPSLA